LTVLPCRLGVSVGAVALFLTAGCAGQPGSARDSTPSSSLTLDGRPLPITSTCVVSGSTPPCINPSHPTPENEIICNVTGNAGKEIQVWLTQPEVFFINATGVKWVRDRYGNGDVAVHGGVSQFDPLTGAMVDATLDGHHLSGIVGCQ